MSVKYFKNRAEAGRKLAEALKKYDMTGSVILALPRGGVVVAKEVSDSLKLPLDLVIVRKIGHPFNPEFAIGALSESGNLIDDGMELEAVDPEWLKKEIEREREEALRRRELYMGKRSHLNLENKTAIVIDDGLATGMTMLAAIDEVRKRNPAKIVVAVPVSPPEVAELIKSQVDEFIVLLIPEIFLGGVAVYYQDFSQVEDEEVIRLLAESEKASDRF